MDLSTKLKLCQSVFYSKCFGQEKISTNRREVSVSNIRTDVGVCRLVPTWPPIPYVYSNQGFETAQINPRIIFKERVAFD